MAPPLRTPGSTRALRSSTPRKSRTIPLQVTPLEERTLLAAQPVASNPVLVWNEIALDAIRAEKTAPPVAARNLAIVQTAVNDAVRSVTQTVRTHSSLPRTTRQTAIDTAVATAAHDTLVVLFPTQRSRLDSRYQAQVATVTDTTAANLGITRGQNVARTVLASRANDGAATLVAATESDQPGLWRPTAPAFARAVLPQWPGVTPFTLKSARQFRPPPPPALTSRVYADALVQVQELGSAQSSARTAEQTQIALFWADGAGTETPPGHWNAIAQDLAASRHLGTARTAQIFAALNLVLADAGIAAWDAKYADNCWRPITAIRLADQDGNPATTADPTWTPLLVTPAFPSYVSGHSTFSAAAAIVLTRFYGAHTRFTTTSDALPNVTRSFRSLAAAASEAGLSRIYGGIHFNFDNTEGLKLGRAVARQTLARVGNPR